MFFVILNLTVSSPNSLLVFTTVLVPIADTLVSFIFPPMAEISSIFNLLVKVCSFACVEKYFELYA